MSRRHVLMLVVLSAIWGASFMFIKVAVRELEPSTLVFVRLLLGAVMLVAVVPLRVPLADALRSARGYVLPLAFTGLLNTTIPFWLLSWSETRIDSSFAAILQASAPLFTALLAYFFFHSERVSGLRLGGVLIGFGGVALLVGVTPEGSLPAAVAVLGTAFCYSVSALVAGRSLRGLPPIVTAAAASTLATLFSAPLGIAQMPNHVPGWKVLGSVAFLGVVGLGLAYLLYFGIIQGAGASRAILVTYLVPPTALFYGAAILDEPVKASAVGGLALILGGVALGSGNVRGLRRRRAAEAEA